MQLTAYSICFEMEVSWHCLETSVLHCDTVSGSGWGGEHRLKAQGSGHVTCAQQARHGPEKVCVWGVCGAQEAGPALVGVTSVSGEP